MVQPELARPPARPETDHGRTWARDAIVYAQKTGSFEQVVNADVR